MASANKIMFFSAYEVKEKRITWLRSYLEA